MEIRTAQLLDFTLLENYDNHIRKDILMKQIEDKHIMIAEQNSSFLGWLRYNLFWDSIPFMNMLFFLDEYRGKGYGTILILEWEKEMKAQGYNIVMTSTQANEYSQHFYRKLGYSDVGGFMPPDEPLELILLKHI
jgi:ribosomal protein S18 acetylase RimI-like enzyme